MTLKWDGRECWAVVLGASSGFGAAAAKAWAQAGFGIIGVHLDMRATRATAEAVRDEIESMGVPVVFHNVNAADDVKRERVIGAMGELFEERRAAGENPMVGAMLHSLAFGATLHYITDQEGRKELPADPGRAADWFRLAAEQGNPNAQYNLGKLYYRGQGMPRNYDLAADWLQKAADQDHLKAINHLGILYNRGLGVEADPKRGFELALRAAELGEPAAQLNLASQYVRGNGPEQDFVQALKWHTIFDSHEIPGAGLPMDWVDNNMTPEEVEEAKRLAAEWLAEHPAQPKE